MSVDPRAVESLLAFWADAGVEALYGETPVDRTAAAAPRASPSRALGELGPSAGASTPGPVAPPRPAPAGRPPAKPPSATLASPAPAIDDALATARRAAAAADDLTALKAAIAAFDGCALKSGARQAVFARGAPDAPVMVIGEGPGADEDAQGAPFVGRAGQLLDRMLGAAGLTERVFITNTVFWRPPGNRTPTLDEQAVCAPFLERAIALVKPRLLLLAGGASAKAMLGRSEGVKPGEGILALRGRWFPWRSADGGLEIPALPTLHPAFLLRQPAAKRKSWADLLILAERLDREA